MNLRDLVGRMAIRTDKVREVMPWEMERAFRLDFMVPVPTFDREKYMDEPVRILAVEGSQVVIEKDGKRKLLERSTLMNAGRIMRDFCIRKRKRRKRLKS